MPSDKAYQSTKEILLRRATMNPDFTPLAEWIDHTFQVKTVNIVYDTFDKGLRPRLNICFEFEREKRRFDEENGFNFDAKKQQMIADQFRQILQEQKIIKGKRWFDRLLPSQREKYKTDDVWVIYSAFKPIARIEANENITVRSIARLKNELNHPDLWEISRGFSTTTFFVYTDDQVRQYENSEVRRYWADKYFDLLEPHNEFGYFKRDTFNIYIDSKENFDKNYQGNWYYYYK